MPFPKQQERRAVGAHPGIIGPTFVIDTLLCVELGVRAGRMGKIPTALSPNVTA